MSAVFQYLLYIVIGGLAALILAGLLGAENPRKTRRERPQRVYYHWDDSTRR